MSAIWLGNPAYWLRKQVKWLENQNYLIGKPENWLEKPT
jgi:hypothetical protein